MQYAWTQLLYKGYKLKTTIFALIGAEIEIQLSISI